MNQMQQKKLIIFYKSRHPNKTEHIFFQMSTMAFDYYLNFKLNCRFSSVYSNWEVSMYLKLNYTFAIYRLILKADTHLQYTVERYQGVNVHTGNRTEDSGSLSFPCKKILWENDILQESFILLPVLTNKKRKFKIFNHWYPMSFSDIT